ncbi:MAG: hypothetical protein ACD_23C01368G0002 [uncultured bacterium]|nr:MAG: hypothetical protein ACD_23C01368G0002 [uncultured bacterium]
MTMPAWVTFGSAVLGMCIVVVLVHRRSPVSMAIETERASRPEELSDAKLVHTETLFRVSKPVGLVARLDRAYQMPSGLVVLVEFKSRWINRPILSDVIQLSVQRMAVEGQTRQAVASHGYVVVKAPGKHAPQTAHRVELMSDVQVLALIKRRDDILAGRVAPQ